MLRSIADLVVGSAAPGLGGAGGQRKTATRNRKRAKRKRKRTLTDGRAAGQAAAPPQGEQVEDGLAQAVRLRVQVVVEHGRRARVREDVGVALGQVVRGEGPVVERRALFWRFVLVFVSGRFGVWLFVFYVFLLVFGVWRWFGHLVGWGHRDESCS